MKLNENLLKHHRLERGRSLGSLAGCGWDMGTFAPLWFSPWPRVLAKLRLSLQTAKQPHYNFPNKPSSYLCHAGVWDSVCVHI